MDKSRQETAVEWFQEKTWELKMLLEKQQISIDEYGVAYYDILEEAKQMESKQIIDAWEDGAQAEHRAHINGKADKSSLDYYNETYKQQ